MSASAAPEERLDDDDESMVGPDDSAPTQTLRRSSRHPSNGTSAPTRDAREVCAAEAERGRPGKQVQQQDQQVEPQQSHERVAERVHLARRRPAPSRPPTRRAIRPRRCVARLVLVPKVGVAQPVPKYTRGRLIPLVHHAAHRGMREVAGSDREKGGKLMSKAVWLEAAQIACDIVIESCKKPSMLHLG